MFRSFHTFYTKHLFLFNTISSGVITTSGDMLMQKITKSESHDWDRTYKMAFVGFSMGPMEHIFYIKLEKIIPINVKNAVLKKILLDQIIGAPVFIATFFALCNLWEKQPENSLNEIKSKFLDIYKVDLLVWPAAQFINFKYLAPQYRVLYVSSISVIYTAFLSYMKHQ